MLEPLRERAIASLAVQESLVSAISDCLLVSAPINFTLPQAGGSDAVAAGQGRERERSPSRLAHDVATTAHLVCCAHEQLATHGSHLAPRDEKRQHQPMLRTTSRRYVFGGAASPHVEHEGGDVSHDARQSTAWLVLDAAFVFRVEARRPAKNRC